MNVLIMADYRTPNSGNFIASLIELSDKMKQKGNCMVFVVPNTPGGYSWAEWLRSYGNEVLYFDEKREENKILQELKEIISKYDISLIHSHFGYLHKILVKNNKMLNVKIIFHDHMDYSAEVSQNQQQLRQTIYSVIYRLKGIGVISVMEKKDRGYRLCGKKLHWYVPNGLSLRRNIDRSLTRRECRKKLGIAENEKLCLFLGWDIKRKGVDIAIKAVEAYRQKDPSLVLGIVGFGGNPTQEQLTHIKECVDVEPNKQWVKFFHSTEDMFAYHRAADIYLSASRAEAFSYGILEAISQNVPVVVSNITGTKWSWEYSKCITFASENVEECAKAMSKALELRNHPSNAQDIVDKFSIDMWCKQIIKVYEMIIQ